VLLGIELLRAVDAHRADNLQRRRLGRPTRSLEEFCAQELDVSLDERSDDDEDSMPNEGQLSFPSIDEVLGGPPVRSSPVPAPPAGAAA